MLFILDLEFLWFVWNLRKLKNFLILSLFSETWSIKFGSFFFPIEWITRISLVIIHWRAVRIPRMLQLTVQMLKASIFQSFSYMYSKMLTLDLICFHSVSFLFHWSFKDISDETITDRSIGEKSTSVCHSYTRAFTVINCNRIINKIILLFTCWRWC
jgi:hypothetical protein